MKIVSRWLIVALLCLSACQPDQVYVERAVPGIPAADRQELLAYTCKVSGPGGTWGSGVWLDRTHVLTAYHCVQGEGEHEGMVVSGQHDWRGVGVVVITNPASDLAVIRTSEGGPRECPLLMDPPRQFEFCAACGYQSIGIPQYTEGAIQSLDFQGFLVHSALSLPGNSGCGIWVRRRGEWRLVSIHQRGETGNAHVKFSCRWDSMLNFIAAWQAMPAHQR